MASIRQKKAFDKSMENYGNVSKAMREAGYSKNTAKNPKVLTESKGWKELLEEYLPESELAKAHKELLEQKQLAYFVFPRRMKDEEIEANMEANGLDLIVIRESDKGRMAFYSIVDANARKSALEMGYKLRGSYAPDRVESTVKVDLENKEKAKNAIKGIFN